MNRIGIVFIFVSSAFLTGISGCDDRMKVGLYKYELSSCPVENFVVPKTASYQKWELSEKEPRWKCPGSSYYLLANEKVRKRENIGSDDALNLYIKLQRGPTCSLIVAVAYDKYDREPKQRFSNFADNAANAIFQGPITLKTQSPEFEEIGTPEDFKKWCSGTTHGQPAD